MSDKELETLVRNELDDVVRVYFSFERMVVARKERGNITKELSNETLQKIFDSGRLVTEVLADSSEDVYE